MCIRDSFTVVKVGKYKSYTETYTEDKMSDANREQVSRYIGGLWLQMLGDVSTSRNISKDSLNRYACLLYTSTGSANWQASSLTT